MCSSDMRPAKKSMWRDFSLGKESSLLLNLMMMVKPKKNLCKYCLFLKSLRTPYALKGNAHLVVLGYEEQHGWKNSLLDRTVGIKTSWDAHRLNKERLCLMSVSCLYWAGHGSQTYQENVKSWIHLLLPVICGRVTKKWIQMEGYWVKVRIAVVCTYRVWCREDGWCSTPSRPQCTSNSHSSGIEGGTIISQSVMIGLQVQISEIKRTVLKIQNISFLCYLFI